MINNGISINGKHSFADYGLYISESNIGVPTIKKITETVPYKSGQYDFTYLNGSPAWENREIWYSFDITGNTVAEMYEKREEVIDWLMHIYNADIYDDEFSGWHFHGDFENIDWSEDGEQGSLTVTFTCYPFMISNTVTTKVLAIGTHTIVIDGENVVPIATASGTASVTINNSVTSVTGTATLGIPLERGTNTVVVAGSSVTLAYNEMKMK